MMNRKSSARAWYTIFTKGKGRMSPSTCTHSREPRHAPAGGTRETEEAPSPGSCRKGQRRQPRLQREGRQLTSWAKVVTFSLLKSSSFLYL